MKKFIVILCAAVFTCASCDKFGSESNKESKLCYVASVDEPKDVIADESREEVVYITPYGKRYHNEYCSTIQGHDISVVSRSEAASMGRTPCRRCNP